MTLTPESPAIVPSGGSASNPARNFTSRYGAALAFAEDKHRGHVRKDTDIPYVSHLVSVSALVMEHGGDEDEAIAGLLHYRELVRAFHGRGAAVPAGLVDELHRVVATLHELARSRGAAFAEADLDF